MKKYIKRTIKKSARILFKVHRSSGPRMGFFPKAWHVEYKYLAMLIIAILAFTIYQKYEQKTQTSSLDTTTLTGSDIRCIDGDTFAFGDTKVRLLAVDTPESVKVGVDPEKYSLEASDRTCSILQSAASIEFRFDEGNEVDKYDRILYWVYADGVLLQEVLISEGLAEIKYVNNKTVDKSILHILEQAQKDAQNQSLGLWE